MQGRAKGDRERIVALAHQSAVLMGHLYSKSGVKPLAYYLKEEKKQTPDQGAKKVLEMFKRIKAKQDA